MTMGPPNPYGKSLHPPHPGLSKVLPSFAPHPKAVLPQPVAPVPGPHSAFKTGLPSFPSIYNIFHAPKRK